MIQTSKSLAMGESSRTIMQRPLWKAVWRMKVPHKVKIFALRACKEGLPTFKNLQQKKVWLENTCFFVTRPLKIHLMLSFYSPELVATLPTFHMGLTLPS